MLRKEYCLIITLIVHLLTLLSIMDKVILLLGSNLGNRIDFLNKSIELINSEVGIINKTSSVYESEPWGFSSSQLFLNQVLIVETNYEPDIILSKLQKIEKELGRSLNSKTYQDRNIDIDILFYNDLILESRDLTIPHPQLHLRDFTMIPLVEIAGDYIHPVFGQRLDMLSTKFQNKNSVKVVEFIKPPLTL